MALPMELYAFDGPAPSHDKIWEALCGILNREVRREVFESNESVGSDWRAAEERGCYLLGAKTTTFIDGKCSVEINTYLRGDKVCAHLDHRGSALATALNSAMIQLGGRVDRGEDRKERRDIA
jgi:hypothetical protein